MLQDTQITDFLRSTLNIERLFSIFTDIRKNPTISLRTLLLSVFLMPFYGLTSLLALDTAARKKSFKKLFRCKRKMLFSDTTAARVLSWLKPWQSRQFLQSFVERFEELGLLEKALEPGGVPQRIGILDGSVMGGHHHVTFCLHGSIDYPFIIEDQGKRGKELPTALRVLKEAHAWLGPRFPNLLLCDSLYFNANSFKSAREKGAHILIKSSSPEFRTVLQDAQFIFEHSMRTKIKRKRGFDDERFCHWSIEITSGEFAGYPIQIAHLVEDYPKRTRNAHTESWIVTTDLSLSSLAIREAAHLRWRIENNVFKRISHLAGTKRFYFKDPRPFYTMLRLFCAALAAFDAFICIVKQREKEFKRLLDGAKSTWKNIFSLLQDQLEEGVFSW